MFAQSQVTCNECGGRGTVIKKMCPHCQGNKVVDHTAHYTLDITPGMPEGHEVVFEGEADESPDWEPGDVVLRVRSKKEKGAWRRKETSLYWKQTIGIDEVSRSFCICGWMIDKHQSGFNGFREERHAPRRQNPSNCKKGGHPTRYAFIFSFVTGHQVLNVFCRFRPSGKRRGYAIVWVQELQRRSVYRIQRGVTS